MPSAKYVSEECPYDEVPWDFDPNEVPDISDAGGGPFGAAALPDFERGMPSQKGELGPIKRSLQVNSHLALTQLGYGARMNELTEAVEVRRDGQLVSVDKTLVPSLISEIWHKFRFEPPAAKVEEALYTMARQSSFNPLQQMLNGLPAWDGNDRPLGAYMRTHGNEEERKLQGVWLEYWLSAAIARALRPGCAWENMLILQGPQGCGKSRFLRALAGDEWFSDNVPFHVNDDKVWVESIMKYWIMECAELRGLKSGARADQIKARLSSRTDTVRLAYGKVLKERPRHCVFAGSTNERHVLADPTGLRRFWTIPVQEIDWRKVERDRRQILAQCMARGRWKSDRTLELPSEYWPLGAQVAEKFRDRNAFEDYVQEKFGQCDKGWMTIPNCHRLLGAYNMGRMPSKQEQGQIRDAMVLAGWAHVQRTSPHGGRPRVYVKGYGKNEPLEAQDEILPDA